MVNFTGYSLMKPTSRESVKSLIMKLNPYITEKDLIRLGPNGDGGYLVPNDLENIIACFSPSVDMISEFEMDCLKNGMKIYMADKTVDKPNIDIPISQYEFIKKHIGCTNNSNYLTIDEWVNSSLVNENNDLLLQMDIEGGEYISLINISDSLMKRFRILVIEFHALDQLWNLQFFNIAQQVFDKILQTHTCVHIHPNNDRGIDKTFGIEIPRTAEFTFWRNDRAKFENHQMNFPHQLDFDNTDNKHIPLPDIWFDCK